MYHLKTSTKKKSASLHRGKENQVPPLLFLASCCFFLEQSFDDNTAWWQRKRENRKDSLVAVEHQLRLLGDLPHPHRAVPPSRRYAALAAQAVQACDGVLMAEAAERLSENLHLQPRSLKTALQLGTLTEFPRRRFHPRSTL